PGPPLDGDRDHVLDRVLFLADLRARWADHLAPGLAAAVARLAPADMARARGAGHHRVLRWDRPHPAHRELSLGAGLAGRAVRLYRDDLGLPARLLLLRRAAHHLRLYRRGDRRGGGTVRDLARAPAWPQAHARGRRAAD